MSFHLKGGDVMDFFVALLIFFFVILVIKSGATILPFNRYFVEGHKNRFFRWVITPWGKKW